MDFEKRYKEIYKEFEKRYDIESLNSPNDKANLDTFIRNHIVIESLQQRLNELAQDTKNIDDNTVKIKKLNDTIRDLSETNIQLERQLGIDRKTRKQDQEQSHVEYIEGIKKLAVDFLNDPDRLVKMYCDTCKIMIGRISGVYDTTFYRAEFQCPQCKKNKKVERKERDIFYDLKPSDRDWRRKYPIEIVQAKQSASPDIDVEDDIMLDGDLGLSFEEE